MVSWIMVEIDIEGQEDKYCDQPKVIYIDLNGGYSGVYTYEKRSYTTYLYILLSVSYISLKIYMLNFSAEYKLSSYFFNDFKK